ncbi:hemerythrin domain-containing protein [Nitrospira sp. M1]
MDIYQALKKDHRILNALFLKLLGSQLEDTEREIIFFDLKNALVAHHESEEKVFYPAFEEWQGLGKTINSALEQREELAYSLGKIEQVTLHHQNWREKLEDLHSCLRDHMQIEEKIIFKEARKVFFETRAMRLAKEFTQVREQVEREILSTVYR